MFHDVAKQAGGVNLLFHFRKPTPLDKQTVIRMNKDTLYSMGVVDTEGGATITVPKIPDGRYASVYLADNDHCVPFVIYEPGTHNLPNDTKYLGVGLRIQVFDPNDPAELELISELQDQFIIRTNSADALPPFRWDTRSLDALRAQYEKDSAKYGSWKGMQGPRGKVDEKIRHIAAAAAWGLFPEWDATYLNYSGGHDPNVCHKATYGVPENNAFWSITVYGNDGYMKHDNSIINASNVKLNDDGTFTVHYGSKEVCGDVPNRLDVAEGWNFLMRVYRPGESVIDGKYEMPKATPVSGESASAQSIETRLGPLSFDHALPTAETRRRLYDELDFQRAVQAVLWADPAINNALFRRAMEKVGVPNLGAMVYDSRMHPGQETLTPNQSVIYLYACINLKETGPVVYIVPPGPINAGFFDMWMRPVYDFGTVGPSKGKGDTILIVPPGYEGALPDGYQIARPQTWQVFSITRVSIKPDMDESQGTALLKKTQTCRLADEKTRPAKHFVKMGDPAKGGKEFRMNRPTGLDYWKLLHQIIDEETIEDRDRIMLGTLAAIGGIRPVASARVGEAIRAAGPSPPVAAWRRRGETEICRAQQTRAEATGLILLRGKRA